MTRRDTNQVDTYARSVVAGEIPAGKYHRLACARHLRDREREDTPGFPFVFEWAIADRFFRFASKLKHYKGQWAGQAIVLTACQLFRLGSVFGWVHVHTGLRRFRSAYNELPRKSGKSLEAGIVADYTTFCDGEPGAEGYCAATKREQALIVFRDAKKLIQSSGLKRRIKVHVGNLHDPESSSRLEPLSADYGTMDGLHPHCVIVDELHAHKDRGVLDVLETAMGARRQPLMFQITTAGDDPVSVCGDQHDYACKILEELVVDDSFFAFIASADPGDDWQDERTWIKANPMWGISVNPEDMRALALKATSMPSAAAAFRQKRLNEWVSASHPCLSVDGWRRGQTTWTPDDMAHEQCFVGIDLASKTDLCCCSLVFPPSGSRTSWRIIQHIWTPEDTLIERGRRDRAPYSVWRDQGWLQTNPGTRIDHQLIRGVLRHARATYAVERIGFDPWHADTLINQLLSEDGFTEDQVLEVPQNYRGMSAACLEMQALILGGMVDARGCPVTAWSVSNVVANADGKENLMFAKGRSRGRIDPVIAPTIGMALALRAPAEPASVYDTAGLFFV